MAPRYQTVVEYVQVPLSAVELQDMAELQKLTERLAKELKDGAASASSGLTKSLGDVLRRGFDRDMAQRKEKLDALQKRVEQLQAACQRREQARDEIISHRIRGMELHAQGLSYEGTKAWKATSTGAYGYGYSVPVQPPVGPLELRPRKK